jgi:hypothetical protein
MAPWRLTMSRCTRRSTSRTWSRPALRAAACGGCPRPRCYPRLGLSARRVAPASRSRHQEAGHLNALPHTLASGDPPAERNAWSSRRTTMKSVALQLPPIVVLAKGKLSSDRKSGLADTYLKPLCQNSCPMRGRGSRNVRPY